MLSKHKNLIMYFAEFLKRFNCYTHHLICYSRRAEQHKKRERNSWAFLPILMYRHKNNNKKQQQQSLTWVQSVFLIAQMGNTERDLVNVNKMKENYVHVLHESGNLLIMKITIKPNRYIIIKWNGHGPEQYLYRHTTTILRCHIIVINERWRWYVGESGELILGYWNSRIWVIVGWRWWSDIGRYTKKYYNACNG